MEIIAFSFLALFFGLAVFNCVTAPRLHRLRIDSNDPLPTASVLIPARNEAHNLKNLIPSLLRSEYTNFKIRILDDDSEDETQQVAETLLSASQIPYQIIRGQKWSPEFGLTGKNWACHQLSQAAHEEIFIFCDADVTISPKLTERTLRLIQQNPKASGMSGLPNLKTSGFLQWLIMPWIMQIPLGISLPLGFAWRWPRPSMQLANGQWLAIRRTDYLAAGGHLALGKAVLDDIQLAQNLVVHSRGGLIPAVATQDLEVCMYSNWKNMVTGFSKNLVQIYGGRPMNFIFLMLGLNFIFFIPLLSLNKPTPIMLCAFGLVFLLRAVTALLFGRSLMQTFLQVLLLWPALFALNYFSVLVLKNQMLHKTDWKGRSTSLARFKI